jgi:hypothetical protein
VEYVPIGRGGKVAARVTLDGEPILVESFDLTKKRARDAFVEQVYQSHPGLDRTALEQELLRKAVELTSRAGSQDGQSHSNAATLLRQMPEAVVQAAVAMLADPHLMDRIVEDAHALGLAGEKELVQQVFLTGVSRLLPHPLACIVQGVSAAGKDFSKNLVARFFPPEAICDADQLSPQALFYMHPGTLAHRFVIVGERSRAKNPEATRALREMLAKGRLSKALPVRINGQLETRVITQDGPIAYIESTSLTKVFHEDANRCLLLTADESAEQTRRILVTMADLAAGGRLVEDENIVLQHHAAASQNLRRRGPLCRATGQPFSHQPR